MAAKMIGLGFIIHMQCPRFQKLTTHGYKVTGIFFHLIFIYSKNVMFMDIIFSHFRSCENCEHDTTQTLYYYSI